MFVTDLHQMMAAGRWWKEVDERQEESEAIITIRLHARTINVRRNAPFCLFPIRIIIDYCFLEHPHVPNSRPSTVTSLDSPGRGMRDRSYDGR